MSTSLVTRLKACLLVLLAIALGAATWELYKCAAPGGGVSLFGVRVLPRTDDGSMPHLWSIIDAFSHQEVSLSFSSGQTVFNSVLFAALYSFRLAAAGFAVGVVIGVLLAALMQRFALARRALLPYVVVSQTVPLIALAPLVVGWGGSLQLWGLQWQSWMSVSAIAAYLAFFPVALGVLRGLSAAEQIQLDLLHCCAASRWQTTLRLRLPTAVPYLMPSLRLAAAASVVGAIVAEISTGTKGGIGRLIISYAQQGTSDSARLYTPIIGAAILGLVATGLVASLELALGRYRGTAAKR